MGKPFYLPAIGSIEKMNHENFLNKLSRSMPWLALLSFILLALSIAFTIEGSPGLLFAFFLLIIGVTIFLISKNQKHMRFDSVSRKDGFICIFSLIFVMLGLILTFIFAYIYIGILVLFFGFAGIFWLERRFA